MRGFCPSKVAAIESVWLLGRMLGKKQLTGQGNQSSSFKKEYLSMHLAVQVYLYLLYLYIWVFPKIGVPKMDGL